jgi:peptidoglycan/xylan/chitin deacetylase (PgdA/CDA1 family)
MFDLTLSFDNGPDASVTPDVLAVLREHGVLSTFFTVGQHLAAEGGLALAERAWRDGHWIGNHTWSHTVPLGQSGAADLVEREVVSTQNLLAPYAHPQRWFRPFGGGGNLDRRLLNEAVVHYLIANRFSCVLWNAVPRDWADPDGWVETALEQCTQNPWTLMVLHDLPTGAMRHLPRFLRAAHDRGARFRQEFPPACVPLVAGRLAGDLDPYTTPAAIARDA